MKNLIVMLVSIVFSMSLYADGEDPSQGRCHEIFSPVCGAIQTSSGPVYSIYDNSCFLQASGASPALLTQCTPQPGVIPSNPPTQEEPSIGSQTFCPAVYAPVCGRLTSSSDTNPGKARYEIYSNSCWLADAGAVQVDRSECEQALGDDMSDIIPPQPDDRRACPMVYNPVCGVKDGNYKMYSNSCVRSVDGASEAEQSLCIADMMEPVVDFNCPMNYAPVCGEKNGEVQQYPNECVMQHAEATEVDSIRCFGGDDNADPQLCPAVYAPVCGIKSSYDPSVRCASNESCPMLEERRTYPSMCALENDRASFVSSGPCEVSESTHNCEALGVEIICGREANGNYRPFMNRCYLDEAGASQALAERCAGNSPSNTTLNALSSLLGEIEEDSEENIGCPEGEQAQFRSSSSSCRPVTVSTNNEAVNQAVENIYQGTSPSSVANSLQVAVKQEMINAIENYNIYKNCSSDCPVKFQPAFSRFRAMERRGMNIQESINSFSSPDDLEVIEDQLIGLEGNCEDSRIRAIRAYSRLKEGILDHLRLDVNDDIDNNILEGAENMSMQEFRNISNTDIRYVPNTPPSVENGNYKKYKIQTPSGTFVVEVMASRVQEQDGPAQKLDLFVRNVEEKYSLPISIDRGSRPESWGEGNFRMVQYQRGAPNRGNSEQHRRDMQQHLGFDIFNGVEPDDFSDVGSPDDRGW